MLLATLWSSCQLPKQSESPATATSTADIAPIPLSKEALYTAACAKADTLFAQKKFRHAAQQYALALTYSPKDAYATQQQRKCELLFSPTLSTKKDTLRKPLTPATPTIPLPTMVAIGSGSFLMGSLANTPNSDQDEYPQHTVFVKPFFLAETEVTVEQYRAFCTATGRMMPAAPAWGWIDTHPVVNVSWEDANEYCKWLSNKTKENYRLPTEEEWEFAARGGTISQNTRYAGSEDADAIGWYVGNSEGSTRPVGSRQPNELLLHDMSGNIWEWCSTWYTAYPGGTISKESNTYRCCRGGSWNYGASVLRCADRGGNNPAYKYDYLGFRVAHD